ncbi:HU family DNA-binding protein [Celeribacter arenosi]|uniref:HU domain-containing protein n=1 Tax=Celeribacter arenosi TaxID=792649 RepID=A0ABP7KDL8_9RHOB
MATPKTPAKPKIPVTPKIPATPEKDAASEPGNAVSKRDFLNRVTQASGAKRSVAKKVLEAAMKELGDVLQEGKDVNLPPLGKLSVNRMKEVPNAHVMVVKLRRSKAMLAPAVDDAPEGTDES